VADEERLRPEKSEVMALICDNTKARQLLGWEPEYTLEQGLSHTIDYIQHNLNRYKPTLFNR
jgi:dTDP-glucose 4,6-dehydratase